MRRISNGSAVSEKMHRLFVVQLEMSSILAILMRRTRSQTINHVGKN
jgi:ribosomal protein S17